MTALKTTIQSVLARLAVNLATVSAIRRVYTDPDDAVGFQLPCVVLSACDDPLLHRRLPQWRETGIPVRIRVYLARIDLARQHLAALNLLGDIVDALDLDVTLNGLAREAFWEDGEGLTVTGDLDWGGQAHIGLEGTLRIWVREGLTFT